MVGGPLGTVPVDDRVVGLHKDIHAAGGHEGLVLLPVGLVVAPGLGVLLAYIPLYRPDPGEVGAVIADEARFPIGKSQVNAVGHIEQKFFSIFLKFVGLVSLTL